MMSLAENMTVATTDILRLMMPGPRPTDSEITKIRTYLADLQDGPPRYGCADSETAIHDFDLAAVDVITTVFPMIPDDADAQDLDEWYSIFGDTIVLPLRLRGSIANVIDAEGNEYYAPLWFEGRHHVDIIAASRGQLRRP